MSQEFQALQSQGTWLLVPPPPNQHILGCRWTYRLKHNPDGSIAHYKAHLVAQGHTQEHGIDFMETFCPVTKVPTIRVLLTVAAFHHWPVLQFDVSNAFLHDKLHEHVYMQQPPGHHDPQFPHHVCLLQKAIYGLHQAPRQWFHAFSGHLQQLGFTFSRADPSLMIYAATNVRLDILIYMDNILITGNSPTAIDTLLPKFQQAFSLKVLGQVHHFLGIQVSNIPLVFC